MSNSSKFFLSLAALFALCNCTAASAKETFKEEFANNNQGWELAEGTVIADKELTLTATKGKAKELIYQRVKFKDADITASVRLHADNEADNNAGAGIIFWAQAPDNYYFLLIRPDGKYLIGRRVERFLTPVPTTTDASIKGAGEWNLLRVEFKANKAVFYCNGTQLRTLTGQAPSGESQFGFIAEDGQTASKFVAGFKDCHIIYSPK